jgi:hypothetical protein
MDFVLKSRRVKFLFSLRDAVFMKVCVVMVLWCLVGCVNRCQLTAAPERGGNASGAMAPTVQSDAIDSIQVRHINGAELQYGKDAQFTVRVRYTLSSSDQALLSLNLDQFHNPLSCISSQDVVGTMQAKSGEDYLAKISGGKHSIDFVVTWKGGLLGRADVKSGAISFSSSMWREKPRYEFLTKRFGTDYCLQFK